MPAIELIFKAVFELTVIPLQQQVLLCLNLTGERLGYKFKLLVFCKAQIIESIIIVLLIY